MKKDICRELKSSVSEKKQALFTGSDHCRRNSRMDSQRSGSGLGVAFSLSLLPLARIHVQVLPASFDEVQRGRRGAHQRFVKKRLCKKEKSKSNWCRQGLKAYQQWRKKRKHDGDQSVCPWYHLRVVRTFQQARIRKKNSLANAADALVREELDLIGKYKKDWTCCHRTTLFRT